MATDTVVGTTIGGVGAPIDLLVANPEAASNFAKVGISTLTVHKLTR